MHHIAIVAPHFVPSNLTAVHRARLLATHLPEFGWEPTIITVHEKYYEESLDWELCELLPKDLRIRKAWAFPTKPFRLVGDIGIRGFWGMYQEIRELHRERRIDFLYITIPSNYASLLGPLAHRELGIPYGIDYIDPWVHQFPGSEKKLSKAWFSAHLAEVLEPIALKNVKLISGVAASYYEDVFRRNPWLNGSVKTVAMPYGSSESDFEYLRKNPRKTFLFSDNDGKFHMVYAGAMLPKAYPILELLFQALSYLVSREPALIENFELHFIGTGKSPDDPQGHTILPYIQKYKLEALVHEHPQRIKYLDVLNHLQHCSAILILGSTERHYTPSKVFQAIGARKPIVAVLHEESSAAQIIKKLAAGNIVAFATGQTPSSTQLADMLVRLLSAEISGLFDREILESISSKVSAYYLAQALDSKLNK